MYSSLGRESRQRTTSPGLVTLITATTRKENFKITLCYLVLAQHLVPAKSFGPSEMETEIGGACYSTAQALTVPSSDVLSDLGEADILKFRCAMKVLGLKPYLQQSQRGHFKAAVRTPTTSMATTTAIGTEIDAANQSWPYLTVIVHNQVMT